MTQQIRTAIQILLFSALALADNQEKAEKKALDLQAKTFVKEAKDLEKAGKLLEARTLYGSSVVYRNEGCGGSH